MTSSAPVGFARMLRHLLLHLVDEADLGERRHFARLVEEAHGHRLALDGRQRRDADVEHAARGRSGQRDAAVLGLAPLGDVELREDLQTRCDSGGEALRHAMRDVQHAVDPVAHDQLVLLWLDVDVATPVLGRLEDHRVDEPHERRIGDPVVGFEVVLGCPRRRPIVIVSRNVAFIASAARPSRRSSVSTSLRAATWNTTLRRVANLQLVEAANVLRVRDRDLDRLAVARKRDRADTLEHGERR